MNEEFVEIFKHEIENLFEELYGKLDLLIEEAAFNLSFTYPYDEASYEKIEGVIMEVLQEQFNKAFGEEL